MINHAPPARDAFVVGGAKTVAGGDIATCREPAASEAMTAVACG